MKLYCIIGSFILFWRLAPTFAQNVEISPDDTLRFDQVNIDSSKILPIEVKNTGPSQIRIGDLTFLGSSSSYDIVQYDTARFDSGETRNIDIQFSPNIIGPVYDSLHIQIIIIGPQPDSVITVDLYGEGLAPKIVIDSLAINFGSQIVGTTKNRMLEIKNDGNAELQINSINISDTTHFKLTSEKIQIIQPADSDFIQVSFIPKERGNFNEELIFNTNDPENSEIKITLSGRGIIEGVIDIQPGSLDFDSVEVNSEVVETLTIFNLGDISLQVDSTIFYRGVEFTNISGDNFFVEVGDSSDLLVRFSPESTGQKIDTLTIYSQGNEPKVIPLQGVGITPQIAIEPDEIDFGQVLLNEEKYLSINVHNIGDADLIFSSAISGGEPFERIGTSDNITVKGGSFYEIVIRFTPLSRLRFRDTLRIISNDLQDSILYIPLNGEGIVGPAIKVQPTSIDFGTIVINSDLIMNLMIINEGDLDLIIDSENTRLTKGTDFSLGTFPLKVGKEDTIFIPIIFSPDSEGIKTDVLSIYSNDEDSSPVIIELNGKGIDLFCRIEFSDPAEFQKSYPIEIEICPGLNFEDVNIRLDFKEAGAIAWEQHSMSHFDDNIWTVRIDSNEISDKGFKFRIVVSIDEATIYYSPEYAITIVIPRGKYQYNFTSNRQNEWIMFSIPFEAADTHIDTILKKLGPEGKYTWKIWRTDSSGNYENYYNINNLKTMGNYGRFELGNAFWLYLKDVISDRLTFPELHTIGENSSFTYILQPGWNQIGSPYNFDIRWQEQVIPNDSSWLSIYHYDEDKNENNGWNNNLVETNFTLHPWDGYAVYNKTENDLPLVFNPVSIGNESKIVAKRASLIFWKLICSAQNSTAFAKNVIGMSPLSKIEWDILDYVNPPIIGQEYVTMYFSHPEWREKIINYCTDFRPINDSGDRWDFTIRSSSRTVRFSVLEMDQLPPYFNIKLVDSKLGLSYDINSSKSIELNEIQMDEINRFVLLVGDEQYIKSEENKIERFLPKTYVLKQNYPNPFNPGTFIYFEIPEATEVNLSVYNILGQKIKTLVNDFKISGSYRILWNGTDEKDRETASGIYFYRLTTNRFEKTLKMLKIQ